jgi:hypothetical protein
MTTLDIYDFPHGVTESTLPMGGWLVVSAQQLRAGLLVVTGDTTEAEPSKVPQAPNRLLRELAARSILPNSGRDRNLLGELDREAWGLNGA